MLSRRRIMGAGLAAATVTTKGAWSLAMPGSTAASEPDARLKAYHMPLESGPHERTFMQWPVSRAAYGARDLDAVQRSIADIANAIAEFEPVAMLGADTARTGNRRLLSAKVELWDIPTDDLWCRDSGPTFVADAAGRLAIAHLRFNGWGNKQPHANDARIAARVAARLGMPLLETGLVGEQGGVEHDGAGTLLAHASCWANGNRNTLPRDEIARRLELALGARRTIWAPGIAGADITDYHIDALARFVGPGRVLIQIDDAIDHDDPWSVAAHETLRVLEQARDASGRPLQIMKLPEPDAIRSRAPDFVSSYINYYVCNGAVIGARFGDRETDAQARDTLKHLYPEREIVMLDIDPIGESGGGVHCATQQQPRSP
ncbi:peptidyl-arginine deiminase [Sphingomonas sp. IBVSS2]|uniref:agmatine deiminase family protein n=1 Tax=Sphingomonas sp. IBVSS2 TaxID=1985172 RepID=UPI000A2DED3E|nr:agmatine deiminase family protein [Sphingomonas sp. IBVSS2]OSZ68309.1 peptidyl-arginine deiminase [Sphingomonas sp. IBVSS2]